MPRIKSRAHPLFVVFHTDNDILSAYDSLPQAKEERLSGMTHAVLNRWLDRPPVEFLVGPDVWAKHCHPWSDDGSVARAHLSTCNPTPAKKRARAVRKSTRAPSPQPKTPQAQDTTQPTQASVSTPRTKIPQTLTTEVFRAGQNDETEDAPSRTKKQLKGLQTPQNVPQPLHTHPHEDNGGKDSPHPLLTTTTTTK